MTLKWIRRAGPEGTGILGGRAISEQVSLCVLRWPGGEQFLDGTYWVRVGETCGGGILDFDPGCFDSDRIASFHGAEGAVCWQGDAPPLISPTESCPAGADAGQRCRADEDCAKGLTCTPGRCGAPDAG